MSKSLRPGSAAPGKASSAAPEASRGAPAPRAPRTPRRRSDGERSHREILRAAANLASVEGLEGLSLAALAEHVGLSKSGLFAHFRSKEELQLETIEMAGEIFQEEVVKPALAQPEGVARLRALGERFLDHVRRRTFPGGCFFASVAAEVDGHPGKVRDRIAEIHSGWIALFERGVAEAQVRGELDRDADAAQVAFELLAMFAGAHSAFLLHGDAAFLDRAHRGVDAVLALHTRSARVHPLRAELRVGRYAGASDAVRPRAARSSTPPMRASSSRALNGFTR